MTRSPQARAELGRKAVVSDRPPRANVASRAPLSVPNGRLYIDDGACHHAHNEAGPRLDDTERTNDGLKDADRTNKRYDIVERSGSR